jgi:hypothetical protein
VSVRVIIHVLNEEAILGDLDELPGVQDNCLVVRNPRKRDGKPLNMLAEGVNSVIYPWTRITYVEVLDEMVSTSTSDSIVGFFREDNRSG